MNPNEVSPTRVMVDLPAVHESVRLGRRMVRLFGRAFLFEDKEVDGLMLVASELLANAVDHGGGGGAMKVADLTGDVRMGIELSWNGQAWTMLVEDGGAGDLQEAQDSLTREPCDILEALESERGRGIFLVKEMGCSLTVQQGERGLVFVAKKTL